MKSVLYIDGSNLLMRAYFAAKSSNSSPLHIFANMAHSLKECILPMTQSISHYQYAIFDGKGSLAKRLAIYPEYKQNRIKNDDPALPIYRENALELLDILGFGVYESESGLEADDVIAVLATKTANVGNIPVVVSSDKDFLQLCVHPSIHIYNPHHQTWLNHALFESMMNMKPELFVDYLVLLGDKADNIQGVPGVGEKRALEIVQSGLSLDELKQIYLDNLNQGQADPLPMFKKSKWKENLINCMSSGLIERNQKLIRFMQDDLSFLPNVPYKGLQNKPIDKERLNFFCDTHALFQFKDRVATL